MGRRFLVVLYVLVLLALAAMIGYQERERRASAKPGALAPLLALIDPPITRCSGAAARP
jgi:hypothetical protein